MGLKSGSRDAGLDDSEEEEADQSPEQEESESATEERPELEEESGSESDQSAESSTTSKSDSSRPTMDSLPYKLRRNKVNEGREQVPYFLRGEVIDAEDDLQDTLEELLGEKVYKSDYREAAMVLAQRNPELIAEVLREWGYDLEDN